MTTRRSAFLPLLLLAAQLASQPAARADGAFPDSFNLFAPQAGGGERLLLATTFGLVITDAAQSPWWWVCEEGIGPNLVSMYQVGPEGRIYALYDQYRVARSDDGGRTWLPQPGGMPEGTGIVDLFPDPSTPGRLVAVQVEDGADGVRRYRIAESTDAAASWRVLRAAVELERLESVEVAASDPSRIYAVSRRRPENSAAWEAVLWRTDDGGASWREFPLTPVIGPRVARIAAVDAADAEVLYLRVLNFDDSFDNRGDALAVVRQGGAEVFVPTIAGEAAEIGTATDGATTDATATDTDTATAVDGVRPLILKGSMSTFLRQSDGTLLMAGLEAGAFRSRDGGRSFERWNAAPQLRALAERDGVLYGAGNPVLDGFSLGLSRDGGETWEKLLVWSELCGIYPSPTLAQACKLPWVLLSDNFGARGGGRCPPAPDDAPVDTSTEIGTDPGDAPSGRGGCGCSSGAAGAMVPLLALAVRRRRR